MFFSDIGGVLFGNRRCTRKKMRVFVVEIVMKQWNWKGIIGVASFETCQEPDGYWGQVVTCGLKEHPQVVWCYQRQGTVDSHRTGSRDGRRLPLVLDGSKIQRGLKKDRKVHLHSVNDVPVHRFGDAFR